MKVDKMVQGVRRWYITRADVKVQESYLEALLQKCFINKTNPSLTVILNVKEKVSENKRY